MISQHADLLNDLHDMSRSFVYITRRTTLKEAEDLIVAQEQRIKELEKQLASTKPRICITCGDKSRVVDDLVIEKGYPHIGCSLVNKGHDDLFDQGFTVIELQNGNLTITALHG